MTLEGRDPASFRDPSGFIYRNPQGRLLRQVNPVYAPHYDRLLKSGLAQALIDDGLLIPHEVLDTQHAATEGARAVLAPQELPFITYPYEWGFTQLQDAALLTLTLQRRALDKDLILKDASAFNIQFRGSRPIFIDTLSFACYEEGKPWVAYRQCCEHFLAPLLLMAYGHPTAALALREHLDGLPLEEVSPRLPRTTWLKPGLLTHVHLLAKAKKRYAEARPLDEQNAAHRQLRVSRNGLLGLTENLTHIIQRLTPPPLKSAWTDYYTTNTYSEASAREKAAFVENALKKAQPRLVWDLGANTGVYSRIAAKAGATVIAFDADWACVEAMARAGKQQGEENILPLIMDLSNPSPALGWAHQERAALLDRGPADLTLALALIHHLAIGNNLPFPHQAAFFAQASKQLVIEFVPKTDPQAQRLLQSREDIFDAYTQQAFEHAFSKLFTWEAPQPLQESGRLLYHMDRRV